MLLTPRATKWLAAAWLAGAAAPASAQPPDPKPLAPPPRAPANGAAPAAPKPADPDAALPRVTLAECAAQAHAQRPAVRATRLSLEAAERGAAALNNLGCVAEFLSPDLPVRRQQASRGVIVATAELQKVTQETTQDVTYLYFSYVYAKQQEQTAADVIEQMEIYYDIARGVVESGVRDPKLKIDQFTLYRLQNTIGDVRQLKVKATSGKQLALDGLKQAMGADPAAQFVPSTTELPLMLAGQVSREQVIADALARRPELAQAAAGVDAFRLEVAAQALIKYRPTVGTLASGSDLHARVIPAAARNGEYKPGALAAEMPGTLAGSRDDRVARATALSQRQDALYDEAVSLVRLQAAKAYQDWEAATARVVEAKKKFELGRRLVEESRAAAVARQDPDLLVQNEAIAGRAQADYVEAVYEHVKALAALERVTAGGVTVRFPAR